MIYGNIVLMPDTADTLKAFSTYDGDYMAVFICGHAFTDRLRIGSYYYLGKNKTGKTQLLISSADNYDPDIDGELTVYNADVKSTPTVLNAGEMRYNQTGKSGAIAGTSWYVRPVLYDDKNNIHYGDTYKFLIDSTNNIISEEIINTFYDPRVITNAALYKRKVFAWKVFDNFEASTNISKYSSIVNSGEISNVYMTRYSTINMSDFTDEDVLSLGYKTGDGIWHLVDTVIVGG